MKSPTTAFKSYIRCLIRLQDYLDAGLSDSVQANLLREEMADTWCNLACEQRNYAGDVANVLYGLREAVTVISSSH